jgi:tryptophanase
MSILSFPRIHFRGRFRTNPCTSNNNDVMPEVVDGDHLRLAPALEKMTDAQIAAWLCEKVTMKHRQGDEKAHDLLRAGWNLHGDFFTYFDQAWVTSIQTPESFDTSDPLVHQEVQILGSLNPPYIGERGEPVICDLESTGLATTQLFLGGFRLGPEESSHLLVNYDTRAFMSCLNVSRVAGTYLGEQNFIGLGCTWQFTLPRSALDLERRTSSPGLNHLLKAAGKAAGLAVRFAIYEVEPELTTGQLLEQFKAGNMTDNPAWGYLIGTIGIWNEGEPASEVAGRLLQPPYPRKTVSWQGATEQGKSPGVPAPDQGPPALFGNVVAHVQSSPRVVSLDLVGSFPKDGYRYPKGFDEAPERQADVGTLELAYILNGRTVPIGDVDYGLKDYERYANRGGIVDVPYEAGQEEDIRRGTLLLRGKKDSALNADVELLQEVEVRVVTDDRALYLDPAEKDRPIRLHVTERGGPPTRDVPIYIKEYHSIIRDLSASGIKDVRPEQTVAFQDKPRLNFEGLVTALANSTEPVTVKVSAAGPGSVVLGFQLEDAQWNTSLLPWMTTCYSNLRVYPEDDFPELYAQGRLRWEDVYQQVLRYYYVLFPAMSRRIQLNRPDQLTDPSIVKGLLVRLSKASFYKTFYMPTTRSMSPGRVELLRRWLIQESPEAKDREQKVIEEIPLKLHELVEPYRIKVVEKIRLPSRAEREEILKEASHFVVHVNSRDVFIDLITDSGTGAMSDEQWAGMMKGDEAYMRSRSFLSLEEAVPAIFGKEYKYVVPTHQGRGAEHILMELLLREGDFVLSNTHFDTTRANVMHRKAVPVDLVGDWLWNFDEAQPFKGNFDLARLETALERHHARVPFVMITVLNHSACSSPVSMENIREVARLAGKFGKPIYFDACRFAENAWFIKKREAGYSTKSIPEIVKEMLSYGQGAWMSAKKDAIVNSGGFIALKDEDLTRRCQERLVLYEGFPTYGGLAGRDLEAMAVGLYEGIDEAHLAHRTAQVAYLAGLFEEVGIRVSKPAGGSGVFVDVESLYGHLPPDRFPAIALTNDVYLEGGIRMGAYPFEFKTVEAETGQFVDKAFQFARFAIPRRVYTKGHLDYIGKVMARVKERAPHNKGYRLVYAPEVLAHFFSTFEPIK